MNVGYIVRTKKGKFRPYISNPFETDDDSLMDVVASGELFGKLAEARDFLNTNSQSIHKIYLNPVKTAMGFV